VKSRRLKPGYIKCKDGWVLEAEYEQRLRSSVVMRRKGATFAQIGEAFGVRMQRAQAMVRRGLQLEGAAP
jgi:hypothetical protein